MFSAFASVFPLIEFPHAVTIYHKLDPVNPSQVLPWDPLESSILEFRGGTGQASHSCAERANAQCSHYSHYKIAIDRNHMHVAKIICPSETSFYNVVTLLYSYTQFWHKLVNELDASCSQVCRWIWVNSVKVRKLIISPGSRNNCVKPELSWS